MFIQYILCQKCNFVIKVLEGRSQFEKKDDELTTMGQRRVAIASRRRRRQSGDPAATPTTGNRRGGLLAPPAAPPTRVPTLAADGRYGGRALNNRYTRYVTVLCNLHSTLL